MGRRDHSGRLQAKETMCDNHKLAVTCTKGLYQRKTIGKRFLMRKKRHIKNNAIKYERSVDSLRWRLTERMCVY